MKQKSLVKNAIYNFLYTGLNILFPLITAPYVSKILGASNLGKVNFATAIVNWFILFAVFGTTTYGVREIAKVRDNQEELNKVFSEIVIINGTLSLIVVIIYYIIVFNIQQFKSEQTLFLIMSLSIILNMFAIDWFYQGIEEYRYITIRSAIFKILSLICIFLFIKQVENYILYGLISVLSISLSGVLNYIYSRKYVRLKLKNINPLRHIKSLRIFFLISLIINIYTNLDQTLLGFFVDKKSVAFMNRSKTITNMAISVSTSISNATLPRASYYMKNDKDKFRRLVSEVPNYILWITIPITVGCICLSPNIMYILGGSEFLEATPLLQIIALVIIFSPLSSYLHAQVLVASGKEKLGLLCAAITSVLSLMLNIILIPRIGFIGAGIVQTISEISAVTLRYYIVKKKLNYSEVRLINRSTISYLFAGLLMAIVIIYTRKVVDNLLISFAVNVIIGAIVYYLILLLLQERIMMLVLSKIKSRVDGR